MHIDSQPKESVGLPSYEKVNDVCPVPGMDQCLQDQYESLENFTSNTSKATIEFSDLPLDGRFASHNKKEKRSVLHPQAIKRQKELIGKLTPKGLKDYLPPPQLAPDDECAIESPLQSFISIMKMILSQPPARKEAPPFKFDTTAAALEHNAKLLKSFDCDLNKIIEAHENNVISPGSEFKEPQALGPLLHSHPCWNNFCKILSEGV